MRTFQHSVFAFVKTGKNRSKKNRCIVTDADEENYCSKLHTRDKLVFFLTVHRHQFCVSSTTQILKAAEIGSIAPWKAHIFGNHITMTKLFRKCPTFWTKWELVFLCQKIFELLDFWANYSIVSRIIHTKTRVSRSRNDFNFIISKMVLFVCSTLIKNHIITRNIWPNKILHN